MRKHRILMVFWVLISLLITTCGSSAKKEYRSGSTANVSGEAIFYLSAGSGGYIDVNKVFPDAEALRLVVSGAYWNVADGITVQKASLKAKKETIRRNIGDMSYVYPGIKITAKAELAISPNCLPGDKQIWVELPGLEVIISGFGVEPIFETGYFESPNRLYITTFAVSQK